LPQETEAQRVYYARCRWLTTLFYLQGMRISEVAGGQMGSFFRRLGPDGRDQWWLGHALQVAQALQAQRDDRRASGSPSRTNRGAAVRTKERLPGTKKPRAFTQADLNETILRLATHHTEQPTPASKPGRRSARAH
jgi:hypothetical protein